MRETTDGIGNIHFYLPSTCSSLNKKWIEHKTTRQQDIRGNKSEQSRTIRVRAERRSRLNTNTNLIKRYKSHPVILITKSFQFFIQTFALLLVILVLLVFVSLHFELKRTDTDLWVFTSVTAMEVVGFYVLPIWNDPPVLHSVLESSWKVTANSLKFNFLQDKWKIKFFHCNQ